MSKEGEDVITDLDQLMIKLGQFKRYHMWNYFLIGIMAFFAAFYNVNYIFLAGDVDYRCYIEECETLNTTEYKPTWITIAIPLDSRLSKCHRYTYNDVKQEGEQCQLDKFTNESVKCDKWIYSDYSTIVPEFDLACQDWKRTLVGTIHNTGMLFSLILFGCISDRFGRKTAMCLGATLIGVVGTLKAFAVSYEMYIAVEFLEALVGASVFPVAFVYIIEHLSKRMRVVTASYLGFFLILGEISFALTFRALENWRQWILYAYPPSILFVTYFFLLKESIRWLISKGRTEEAIKIILKAANTNKVVITEDMLTEIIDHKKIDPDEVLETRTLLKQVVSSKVILVRLFVCSFLFITCSFIFYGLAINSVSLTGDKYTNFILVAGVEIIALMANIPMLEKIGRKRTLLIAFICCGVVCISIPFVPKSMSWLAVLAYLLGKITITMAFGGIYIYTSELFPTQGRNTLLGFCSMVGRFGSILAPQSPLLMLYFSSLPLILFGTFSLCASLLLIFVPETLNKSLPDTVAEAEYLAQTNNSRSYNVNHDGVDIK